MNTSEYFRKSILTIIASCFLITVLLTALIFASMQIYPSGKYTMLTYDLSVQHLPIISSLRYLGSKDCSLTFTLFGGLGNDYLAMIAYYLASPIYLLTVFVPLVYMPYAIYFIVLTKLGLCSVSFCLYIMYGLKHRKFRLMIVLLSICYGLSSYSIFYSMALNFLDALILLPLILIGIEKILSEKNILFFVVTLTLSLYCNFYITYMSGLFVCLYLFYRMISLEMNKKEFKRVIISFASSSLISLGLSMPLILPTLKFISLGKLSEAAASDSGIIRVNPLRIIRNLFPAGEFFIKQGGAPQIYCGMITLVLIAVFFRSKQFHRREKIAALSVFLLFFISFIFAPLDTMWHGFKDPAGFPARYSFTCICFMLVISSRALESDTVSAIHSKIRSKKIIYILIMAFVLGEFYLNGASAVMETNNNSSYTMYSQYSNNLSNVEKSLSGIDDNDLYRTVSSRSLTTLDGFMFGYNDINLFSSVYNAAEIEYLKKLGLCGSSLNLRSTGSTPLIESLLGVKYRIGTRNEFYGGSQISGKEPHAVFSNSDALPIGYLVDDTDFVEICGDDPFVNQQDLLSQMLGEQIRLYEKIDYKIKDTANDEYARSSVTELVVNQDGPIWLYFPLGSSEDREKYDIDTSVTIDNYASRRSEECLCLVNGKNEYGMMSKNGSWCVYIGKYKKGDSITIESKSTTCYKDPMIVTMNEPVYHQAMAELALEQLAVTRHGNGVIEGTVKGITGKKLILTLPYMNGYRVFVDGEKTTYESYNPAMISINIPEGMHTIRISYICPGLNTGIAIGIISLLIFLLPATITRINQGRRSLS